MRLVLNIAAMLVVLVALVSLLNQAFGLLPQVGGEPITMQRVAGYLFAPIAWLMGIPWHEAMTAGGLLAPAGSGLRGPTRPLCDPVEGPTRARRRGFRLLPRQSGPP